MRRTLLLVLWPITIVAAYALGVVERDPSRPAVAVAAPRVAPPNAMAPPRTMEGLSAAEVRAILREELAALPAPPLPEAEPDEEPRPSTDDTRLVRAHTILAVGMADGRWSEEEAADLRAAITGLDRDQLREVFSVLFPAINTGRLRLDYRGAPI